MSQQVKDVYSGMKKRFSSSHRGGSFHVSTISLDSELSSEAQAVACEKPTKRKTRPSSFSFSSWKDKHRASSEPAPVVMSLPYGATAATPKAKKTHEHVERNSLTKTITNALHASPLFGGNKSSASMAPQCNGHKSTKEATPLSSSFSTMSFELPHLGGRSVSAGGEFPPSLGNRTLRNSGVHGNMALQLQPGATLCAPNSLNVGKSATNHNLVNYHRVKTAPSSYESSSTSFADLTTSNINSSDCPASSASSRPGNHTIYSPVKKPRERKSRGLSLSFSSSMRMKKEQESGRTEALERAKRASHAMQDQEAPTPHVAPLDSDSEDEFEDTTRPTRLDRRSQSMDFMEQAPTHLIAKIWRKLPLQARLIGGRGSIDLDLQKDRTSFSRSSEARKFALAADKAKVAELQRRKASSPEPAMDILSPGTVKKVRFCATPTIVLADPTDGAGAYTVLESYDDVLVRVCNFAAHDQRPTATKVHEFLERSLAFLHGTRTKHGNIVNISNEEIRMWRRLALHDWMLEEVTTVQAAAALGVKGKDVSAPSSRTSSSATDGTDSDSDSQSRRQLQSLKECVAEPEEEEGEDNDLDVPSSVKFDKLCAVVNCCVNFGQVLYTPLEISDLVRLKFIVEEDGWI